MQLSLEYMGEFLNNKIFILLDHVLLLMDTFIKMAIGRMEEARPFANKKMFRQ